MNMRVSVCVCPFTEQDAICAITLAGFSSGDSDLLIYATIMQAMAASRLTCLFTYGSEDIIGSLVVFFSGATSKPAWNLKISKPHSCAVE